jgi:hypothetical protein
MMLHVQLSFCLCFLPVSGNVALHHSVGPSSLAVLIQRNQAFFAYSIYTLQIHFEKLQEVLDKKLFSFILSVTTKLVCQE